MSDTRILAADGTPLKKKLAQSMFRTKLRAFGLVCPLLALIISAFVLPILFMLSAAVYDDSYSSLMPESTTAMQEWDGESPITEAMAAAMVSDLIRARENKDIGKVANRVNREYSGATSLFKSTSRSAKKFEPPYLEALLAKDKDWNDMELWQGIKIASNTYTLGYIANAIDMRAKATGGFEPQDELRQIHITLFIRTIEISFIVTVACLLLGYPVAYLMANLPLRTSNLLLILVLMPFWTSLLVRTTAWIAMLQGQGVMNDLFVAFGVANDEDRFSLIYNKTGTLIAMTHIMLPFMIMPLYSVMKTISPAYVRAAKSMGATNWTAFWKVYFPQSVPGIGAGSLLVFILAIGYYITPALVGGQDGQMISNIIDFHMRKSLNWNLAAALGFVLLVFVLFFFWIYDRVVGIDNMKLG
ncbi:MAG: ABC transporter permease [Proteobacteria bacterium]|jgi:putative spermidine/putrescine transport system permease protein|nr:ABC transporter permease [Alphaproteobacteria bacterium]MDA0907891.1 ABC transporter permease [Pseudomonadota bacterium]MDA1319379.1 ABC transporter permease [Pseudomonadota bacterium]NBR38505.1 ABC transporter permease [Alphaproteobacteria bacterium]